MEIMQGDAYHIPISIERDKGLITPDTVKCVEVTLGSLSKLYPGDIRYKEEDDTWVLPLSQEDTFSLEPREYPVQLRIKFTDECVIGRNVFRIMVIPCNSQRVL